MKVLLILSLWMLAAFGAWILFVRMGFSFSPRWRGRRLSRRPNLEQSPPSVAAQEPDQVASGLPAALRRPVKRPHTARDRIAK